MNTLSQAIHQTKAFQSWRLILIAVMLLSAAAISGIYITTVQAGSDRGAVTGLTLTSDAPGALTVSWGTASPTPTDYRVDWAKSDEDYQSWKVDEGHKYLDPAVRTVTITDLDHDTDYKVRMRARYYKGEYFGKSWGGPWANATITVAGEPVALPTPTPIPTPTPEPIAEEPVKKDSAKKGSENQRPTRHDPPQGTTSVENTLVSNLGQTALTGGTAIGFSGGTYHNPAVPFTTGSNAFGYHLTSIQLYLSKLLGSGTFDLQVSIRGDNGNPGETALYNFYTSSVFTSDYQLITFTTLDEVTLQPNTKYWLDVNATEGAAGIQRTESNDEDTSSHAGWSIGDHTVSRIDGGDWTTSHNSSLQIKILGHDATPITESVSEPAGGDVAANIHTTGRLAVDSNVTGRHTSNDVDWFAFSAAARTKYQFTVNPGEKGLPYYTLRILDDAGAEQRNSLITAGSDGAYHGSDRRNALPFQTTEEGTYFVSIEPRGSSSTAYTLAMLGDDYPDSSLTMARVDVSEDGRSFGDFHNYLMRTDANPDSSRTADIDWIEVFLERNTTYEITYDVACLHEGEIVGIYDSDGHITYHTGAAFKSNEKIRWCGDITTRFTAPSDGDYHIAVTARGANFPSRSTNNNNPGLHLNNYWNPFTGVHGTLSINRK